MANALCPKPTLMTRLRGSDLVLPQSTMAVPLVLALLPAFGAIESVSQLNAAIQAGPLRTVGFLSQGNYQGVASVLPKLKEDGGPLEVKIFESLEEIEAAVVKGEILAGGSTSRPANEDGRTAMRHAMHSLPRLHSHAPRSAAHPRSGFRTLELADGSRVWPQIWPSLARRSSRCAPPSSSLPVTQHQTASKWAQGGF